MLIPRLRLSWPLIVLGAICAASGTALAGQPHAHPIKWEDLRPSSQGNANSVFPGIAASKEQGETLSERLSNETVRLEGYVLPIDRKADMVYEFFLVPWLGACSHAPQPPANQMVHVIPAAPLRIGKAFDFVSVTGSLHLQIEMTQLFIMDGPAVLTSGYSIGRAQVRPAKFAPPPPIMGNPLGIRTR